MFGLLDTRHLAHKALIVRDKLRMLRHGVLPLIASRIEREVAEGDGENYIIRSFHDLYSSPNMIRMMKSRGVIWAGGRWHLWERREIHAQWGSPKERYHLKDMGVGGKIMIQFVLKKLYGRTWNGLLWLRIGTSGGLL